MNYLDWKYVKPLIDKEKIREMELKYNVKLPNDFKTYLEQYNGGRPSLNVYNTALTNSRVFKCILSYNIDDLENIYDVANIFESNGEIAKYYPLASDPSGNFICYDVSDYSVVLWLHETKEVEKISSNFEELILSLRFE